MRLPSTKHDLDALADLDSASDALLLANAPSLLAWMQDMNWPVAPLISRRLQKLGPALSEPIVEVLRKDDWQWSDWVLVELVVPIPELSELLRDDLIQLRARATKSPNKDAESLLQTIDGLLSRSPSIT